MSVGNYILFESAESFTLATSKNIKTWDGTMEYSTDASSWAAWNGEPISAAGGKLYVRGSGNTYVTSRGNYNWVITGADVACRGNIENVLDYATVASGGHPSMSEDCFGSMFNGCTSLTAAPALPATTLAVTCYQAMFKGCTSLTAAPVLPATTLAWGCYNAMFRGCTSLTAAPALPAETLADCCYLCMFDGCTSLTEAPALPATMLAEDCYEGMFYGCESLTKAPALPATTLAEECYMSMFNGCKYLTAPALPATTLSTACYQGMFEGCKYMKTAPELPAETLADSCYQGMFKDCISLTEAPALPATTLAASCYSGMFRGCESLTKAPVLPATALQANCYQGMFDGCTSLTEAPALPAETLADSCYIAMFGDCTSLTEAPALSAVTLAASCYEGMFSGCTSLTEAPALPVTMLAEGCYGWMFTDCTSLTEAPALPATTLAASCYRGMFYGCTSLTTLPALPATELPAGCYGSMFNGCTALIINSEWSEAVINEYRIPWESDGSAAEDSLTDMFARTGGTFTGTPEINRTYYTSGEAALLKHTATVSHNGKVIAEADAGQTVTLKCAGMKMAGDVVVELAEPDDPFVPTGTKQITANGTYDVTDYANAEVNVPSSIPDGYLKPAGTKPITENGTHDVTEYASVSVAVPDREPLLQEKVAEANGVVTADDGYDGLSRVTVNVEKSADGYTAYDLSTDQMHNPRLKFKIQRPTEAQQSLFVGNQIALIPDDVEHLYEIVSLDYGAIPIAEGVSITPLYFRYGDVCLFYVWENDVEIAKAAFADMGVDTSGITGEGWVSMTDVARSLTEEEVASLNPFWLYEYVAPYGDYFDSLFTFRNRDTDEYADVIDITVNRNSGRILCTERTVTDRDIYVRDRGQVHVGVVDENGNSVDGVDDSNYYESDSVGYLNIEVIGELDSSITVNCYALNGPGTRKEFTALTLNGDILSNSYTFSRCYTYGIKLSLDAGSTSSISRIITNAMVVSNDGSEAYISALRHTTSIVIVME